VIKVVSQNLSSSMDSGGRGAGFCEILANPSNTEGNLCGN